MDAETWQKMAPLIVPLIIGAATIYVAFRQFSLGNKNSYREEYKFAKEFFEDIEQNPRMHKYAKHKGFQAILGTQLIPSEVIAYLMQISDPVRAIDDYTIARSHLKHTTIAGTFCLQFDSTLFFATAKRRKFWLFVFFSGFCFSYVFAFSPCLAWIFNKINSKTMLTLCAFTFPFGMAGIVLCVREFVKLRRAMRLLEQLEEDRRSPELVNTTPFEDQD